MALTLSSLLAWAALAGATPLLPRAVASLNEAATAEAHQRDNGATRAFSNVQIKVRVPQSSFSQADLCRLTVTVDVGREMPFR